VSADLVAVATENHATRDRTVAQNCAMETAHWPLFSLRVSTPTVVLRYPDDADCVALADVAARGVHDPGTMPFTVPWTDVAPPRQQQMTLQHYWLTRAQWTPVEWHLPMAVVVDGTIVGVQALMADRFPDLRAVSSGSWLGADYQGKGLGTEMRHAILHLAFAGLGALYAHSGAFADNGASLAVSRKLGYEEEGRRRVVRRGVPAWLVGFRISRDEWERHRRDDITIDGLAPCLELFGAP
jgi:RimJ/RimL family protein N-acetyltransferase